MLKKDGSKNDLAAPIVATIPVIAATNTFIETNVKKITKKRKHTKHNHKNSNNNNIKNQL